MKNLSKIIFLAILLVCSTENAYAKSSKDKKKPKTEVTNEAADPATEKTWETFKLKSKLAEGKIKTAFPSEPVKEKNKGIDIFTATDNAVTYSLTVMENETFEKLYNTQAIERSNYNDDMEFKVAYLDAFIKEQMKLQHFTTYLLTQDNGNLILDAVSVNAENNETFKDRIVVTSHAGYILTTVVPAEQQDQHDLFINSFKVKSPK